MSHGSKRSTATSRKKGANRNEPAIKHDKVPGKHIHDTDHDIHEDRGIRKQKLGRPRTQGSAPRGGHSF